MIYTITKDIKDLYVLSINNIVVMISRDITAITDEIHNDAENRKLNPRRSYEPATIAVETPPVAEVPVNEDKEILGSLFRL